MRIGASRNANFYLDGDQADPAMLSSSSLVRRGDDTRPLIDHGEASACGSSLTGDCGAWTNVAPIVQGREQRAGSTLGYRWQQEGVHVYCWWLLFNPSILSICDQISLCIRPGCRAGSARAYSDPFAEGLCHGEFSGTPSSALTDRTLCRSEKFSAWRPLASCFESSDRPDFR